MEALKQGEYATCVARRPVIAVVGGFRASEPLLQASEELGKLLVNAGFRVATGGLGGVMEAASRGARQATCWSDGVVIGVLPTLDADSANQYVDLAIPTGMNFARNVVLVAMADVVVAVGGGAGTLSEIALAWQHGKPVVALDKGEGWSSRLAGEQLDHRRPDIIHRAGTADEAVEATMRLIGSLPACNGFLS